MGDTKWIENALAARGKTQVDLARAMRIHPSGVNRILKGERELKAREVPLIEQFLNVRAPSAELGNFSDVGGSYAENMGHQTVPPLAPVYASIAAGDGVTLIQRGDQPISHEPKPVRQARLRGLWAFGAVGEAMSPRFEPGELVWVNPYFQPRPGDDVLFIEMREESREIYCLLRKLVRETPKHWVARQHTPARETTISKDAYTIALVLPRC